MMKLLAMCCVAVFAGFADQTSAEEKQALKLVQPFRCQGSRAPRSHGVDLEKKRLFGPQSRTIRWRLWTWVNGKVIKSIGGIKDTQDALFPGGDFNKLYVSSLDGDQDAAILVFEAVQ